MEVEASCSSSRHYPQEIDQLLEAFGSAFSIDYIASTFLQANYNVEIAGEILLQATSSVGTELHPCIAEGHSKALASGEGSSSMGTELHPCISEGHSKALASGEGSSLMGSVAGVTGIDYLSGKMTSEIDHKDIDDFLFKMLEDGFQLDMDMIHEVFSTCGYEMEKSLEAPLLDKPASALGKSDDIVSKEPEVSSKSHGKMTDPSCEGRSQHPNPVRSSKKKKKEKNGIEKELLLSLFTSKEPEEPKKIQPRKGISSSGRFGRLVTQPLEDSPVEKQTLFVTPLQPSKDEDDDDSFDVHRKAAKEHRATEKEYMKASCEAFLEGDRPRARRLMEQAAFFGQKAREAAIKSLQNIWENRVEDEVMFDYSNFEPKECVQHLRFQLITVCGISSIPHIKVKLENGEGGAKDASRKRLTLKLLEKESIKWTEMEDEKVILIRVSEIEPKSLSFYKS